MSSAENLASGANTATSQQQQQSTPGTGQEKDAAEFRKNFNYPLIKVLTASTLLYFANRCRAPVEIYLTFRNGIN